MSKRTEVTSLYRFFRDDGLLLYVGISKNPPERFTQHKNDKPWWTSVSRITLTHYDTRKEAASAERQAIHDEEPAYNIADYTGEHTWWDYLVARESRLLDVEADMWESIERGDCAEVALGVAYAAARSLVGPGRSTLPVKEQAVLMDGLRRCMDAFELTAGRSLTEDERVLRTVESRAHVHRHLQESAPLCGRDHPCLYCYPDKGWNRDEREAGK